jgi:hypothetical protein
MFVKIETACFWPPEGADRKRREAGSVIDVPADTYELNQSWMKPVDAKEESDAPAAKGGEK